MRIKKILGLIGFAFACVLALASCGKGTFQTEYYGNTYSGDLYISASTENHYYLVSNDKIYQISFNGNKTLYLRDAEFEKIDDNSWKSEKQYPRNYIILINNGQELMYVSNNGATSVYTRTDHIEEP